MFPSARLPRKGQRSHRGREAARDPLARRIADNDHGPRPIAEVLGGDKLAKRLEDLPTAQLRFDLSPRTNPKDLDHAAVLAGVLDELPPVIVHEPTMQVIDGTHRVLAARSLGHDTIRARLFRGTLGEASLLAILCNTTHGKPLTLTERQTAAVDVLRQHADWSDRRVAAVCGLSPKTVTMLRKSATANAPQLRTRVGRDGKSRPTDPIELRQRVAEALKANPAASIRGVAAQTGASEGTVRDVRSRLHRGDDILPPRLAQKRQRVAAHTSTTEADPAHVKAWHQDLVAWMPSRLLPDDTELERFVSAVPLSRVYEVADAARRCADIWRRFADAVEARAGGSFARVK